jgi:hypothetical protein
MKLSRAQIQEGLTQIPMSTILGVSDKALTGKQKAFCKEVAMGATGSEAVRKAYKTKGKPKTNANDAYKLRKRPDIQATIQAYEAAIQAQTYQTPAGLRALVIQTLVNVLTDDEAKDAVKIAAAKTLGTVTEVAAFTERKETRVITSSEDTKARLMLKLRDMMKANATDADIIETDSLMEELKQKPAASEPHPPPTPQAEQEESHVHIHTIPLESSQDFLDPLKSSQDLPAQEKNLSEQDPTPSIQEDPPVGDLK